MSHPDLNRLRLAARGQPLPPLPQTPASPPPAPAARPALLHRPVISPPVRAIGTFGPTAIAALALLAGIHNPVTAWMVAVGYLNLFLAMALRNVGDAASHSRVQRWASLLARLGIVAGAALSAFMALLLTVTLAPILLYIVVFWLVFCGGLRTCARQLRW